MNRDEIKDKLEDKIIEFNDFFSNMFPAMEATTTAQLPEVLPSKELVKSFFQNAKKLERLREFYDTWVFTRELSKKYGWPYKCPECGKLIEKAPCRTHEEAYELGHADNCSQKQTVKEGCVIE